MAEAAAEAVKAASRAAVRAAGVERVARLEARLAEMESRGVGPVRESSRGGGLEMAKEEGATAPGGGQGAQVNQSSLNSSASPYMHAYIHTHVYLHTHTHAHTHACIHTHTHTHTHI